MSHIYICANHGKFIRCAHRPSTSVEGFSDTNATHLIKQPDWSREERERERERERETKETRNELQSDLDIACNCSQLPLSFLTNVLNITKWIRTQNLFLISSSPSDHHHSSSSSNRDHLTSVIGDNATCWHAVGEFCTPARRTYLTSTTGTTLPHLPRVNWHWLDPHDND